MEKKVIVITGTSSGFGKLTAITLANKGHIVIATMRNAYTRNLIVAAELNAIANVEVLEMDVSSTGSVNTAFEKILKKHGRIDVLVNNAGIYAVGIAETFTESDLTNVINVNTMGSWRTIRAGLPQMRKQGDGLIINISSVAGRFSFPFQAVYSCAKFAIEGLTEGLHYEVRPMGVDVVMIQPGPFPTEIFGKIMAGSDTALIAEYGELAKVPAQIGEGIRQMFEAVKPDPQLVADAVAKLVNTPRGKRPLRTVVDAATAHFTEVANAQVKEQFGNFLTAFGMAEMLN